MAEAKSAAVPASPVGPSRAASVREEEAQRVYLVSALGSLARSTTLSAGGELNLQDETGRCLYYLVRGSIEITTMVQETRIVVAVIGADSFFGEVGFLDGLSRVRGLRATAAAEVLSWNFDALLPLQESAPRLFSTLLLYLGRAVCRRFRNVLEEREPLSGYAASLSGGASRPYQETEPLPAAFFETPLGRLVHRMVEDFKAGLFNVSYRLQQELGPGIPPPLAEQGRTVLDSFYRDILELTGCHGDTLDEQRAWGYLFKEIFPYFMRSRFAERIYYKPKGYAGDYLMMEMIYQNQPVGDGKLGELVDGWTLQSAGARAIRGRRRLLASQLAEICGARRGQDRIRIMNLACGANRELFDFLAACEFTEKIEAFCVDIDADALAFTDQQVNTFPHQATIRLMSENLIKWALGRIRHDFGQFDVIYSAGLTDYLDRRLFLALVNRCRQHLKPGGVLVAGNFAPNPDRTFMDHVLQWRLIYRDAEELRGIFAESDFLGQVKILVEEEGINLFVRAMRFEAV